jgi:hypothetical protein
MILLNRAELYIDYEAMCENVTCRMIKVECAVSECRNSKAYREASLN